VTPGILDSSLSGPSAESERSCILSASSRGSWSWAPPGNWSLCSACA
jgi:hypothetical protein